MDESRDDRNEPDLLETTGSRPADEDNLNKRLSQITTLWSQVFLAHQGPTDAAIAAQRLLIERYGRAIYRYLLTILRDPDAADELAQELALRLIRGDFRRA